MDLFYPSIEQLVSEIIAVNHAWKEDYIFSQQLNFKTKQKFNQKIMASGRGEIDADKSKDNSSDRKVVFRFQFRREDFGEWQRNIGFIFSDDLLIFLPSKSNR